MKCSCCRWSARRLPLVSSWTASPTLHQHHSWSTLVRVWRGNVAHLTAITEEGKTTSWFSRICTNSLNEEQPRKAVYKITSYLAAELRWKFDFLTSLRINTETPQLDVLSISAELLFWSFWFTRVLGKKKAKNTVRALKPGVTGE